MWAVTKETTNSVNWLNVSYILTATVVAAGVIVRTIQKMVRKMIEEVIDERIKPHLDEDQQRFMAIQSQLGELRGRRSRNDQS